MNTMKDEIRKLRENAAVAYMGSVREDGAPQIKAMLVLEHESLTTQYFSTNLSSRRAQQFLGNPLASVYYCDESGFKGALFTGKVDVCTDHETRALLWRDGCEIYYPEGVDDPDYCVLKFTAETVNYYHNLENQTISAKEL